MQGLRHAETGKSGLVRLVAFLFVVTVPHLVFLQNTRRGNSATKIVIVIATNPTPTSEIAARTAQFHLQRRSKRLYRSRAKAKRQVMFRSSCHGHPLTFNASVSVRRPDNSCRRSSAFACDCSVRPQRLSACCGCWRSPCVAVARQQAAFVGR